MAWRIVQWRDPGARSATAPRPSAVPVATARGAEARPCRGTAPAP